MASINALNNVNMVPAKITDVKIFKYGRKDKLSLMPQFIEFSFYPSLFRGLMEAELVINDTISLHTNYPIVGEEIIEVTYQHTSDDEQDDRTVNKFFDQLQQNDSSHSTIGQETTKIAFVVQACRQVYPTDTARSSIYSLKLFSEPFQENVKNNVQKAFNKPYSDGIQDILKDYLKVDPTRVNTNNFEASKGSVLTVVPNMLPLPAIMWFVQRAVPQDTTHFNYFFWEDLFGFKLQTLQKLVDEGKKKKESEKKSFIYFSNVNRDPDLSEQQAKSIKQSTITGIQFDKKYATQEKVTAGYFENEYFEIDLLNLRVNSTPFKLPTTVNPGSIANNALNTPDYIKYQQVANPQPGTTTRVRYVTGHGGGDFPNNENFFKDKFGPGVAAMAGLAQNRVTISVPGDTRVIPGDVVNLQLPEFQGFNIVGDDPYISGDWLVTDIKHTINVSMDHVMVLDLARDSFGKLIADKHNYKVS